MKHEVHAGFPRVARRLDIKVYSGRQRVTAVNYFSGSPLFNRTLRFWCAHPPATAAATAARLLPGGHRFHLSDHEFTVRAGAAPPDHVLALAAGALSQPRSGVCGRLFMH